MHYQTCTAKEIDCNTCALVGNASKAQSNRTADVVIRSPLCAQAQRHRKPKRAHAPGHRFAQGRQLYSQRFGTVEPVFANIRHNKRLTRLNHRGRTKVNTQWNLYPWCTTLRSCPRRAWGSTERNRVEMRP
ncbi:MAG: transposase [Rhodoferax sp.]|nr:transposase [Rhodoferax sp.]